MSTELHLDIAAFYTQYNATLEKYGKNKQHWWNQTNRKRINIRQKTIDGYSINQILLSLENYDSSNGFIRFFWRLFTPIEKQRSLLCYWAIKQLKPSANLSKQHKNEAETQELFAILRVHAPRLKSSTLFQPLAYWNLALQTITSLFTAWTYLKNWRKQKTADQPTLKRNLTAEQLQPPITQTLQQSFKTAAEELRHIYFHSKWTSSKKNKEIEKTKLGLAKVYTKLLKTESIQEQSELQSIYHTGLTALAAEEQEYNDRLQNPVPYLTSSSLPFKTWDNLSLHDQWAQYHQIELQRKLEIAKNLLADASGKKEYKAIQTTTKQWLDSYLTAFMQHYANILNSRYNALTSEAVQIAYQQQHQALYQNIETKLKQFDQLFKSMTGHNSWLRKWQQSQTYTPKFKTIPNGEKQTGWNCFDVAADINRADLVQYALEHAENIEFRQLLAPEIKAAAVAVTKDTALPKSMQTKTFHQIKKSYTEAPDCKQFKDAYEACCDAIGRPEGNRPNIDELLTFFANEDNRNIYQVAYTIFNNAYHQIILPTVTKFEKYCLDSETYKTYIHEYYAKQGWIAFQGANQTTSMMDIAARMLDKVIIIHQPKELCGKKYWQEIYRTKNISSTNEVIHIQFNGSHYVRLSPNPKYLSAKQSIAEHRKIAEPSSSIIPSSDSSIATIQPTLTP